MLGSFPPELRWLLPEVRPQLRLHIASFLCLSLASLLALLAPLSMRWLIDGVLPSRDPRLLLAAMALVFASYQGRSALSALGGYLTFRASQHTSNAMRLALLRHLDSLTADYFDRVPAGELLYPFQAPIDEISFFGSDLVPSILRAALAAGVTLLSLAFLSPLLTLAVLPLIPAFLLLRHRYKRKVGRLADGVQSARKRFCAFLEEHLSAVPQIQLLGQIGAQERQASHLLTNTVQSEAVLYKTGALFSAMSSLVVVTAIAAILAGGSLLVFQSKLTIGTLVAFHALLTQLFEPLTTVMEMYSRTQRTFSSIRQIQSLLAAAPSVREHVSPTVVRADALLDIAFRNVSFGYRGRNRTTVRIPRLDIFQGERVAIMGPNGAGKSTLGKLIARLYDIDSGRILIAGCDLRQMALASLRAAVSYLPAQPVLFRRSMADNLRLGKCDASTEEMHRVLGIVGLAKYLEGPALDMLIEPGASNLSSGERERLAIARTLLAEPRILILDETTGSLDPDSEQALLGMIDGLLPRTTLVVISHRWHSVVSMPRILIMEKGRIVADGDPGTLSATNTPYARFINRRAPGA